MSSLPEVWRPLEAYENLYEISTMGRIRSLTKGGFIKTTINSGGYLYVTLYKEGKKKRLPVHRLVINAPSGVLVDHRNKNKQDCSLDNLRRCDKVQNCSNRDKPANNTTGYKGVVKKADGGWEAKIGFKGKRIYLGYFTDPVEAALAYDAAAIKYHQQFCSLNFPNA